ncbi:NAD(P)H-binding protein [Nocardioides nanhaiensis]|uniref:SDR family oxidoreductase n=1 Tax=Nocardioides nanhaiensis TaxID=1476871 RepID=A0ABP8W8N4_9ACTN
MTSSTTLALTGVTGALGGVVAGHLADLAPRLLVRDPGRAPSIDGSEVRTCTYGDAEACLAALEGVDVLFLVSAAESPTRREEHATVIDAAARAGVRHVVYTSFEGAGPDATFTLGRDHHAAEQALADAERTHGMRHTCLRDNFYLDVLPLFADDEGVLRGPAGDGRVAAVARADVAEVAARILRDLVEGGAAAEQHAGAVYRLSGPEALTLDEVASRAGAHLGRPLRYEQETVEEAYASRRAGWPDAQQFELDAWVSTYTAIADGSVAEVTDDVPRLLGHPARTLEDVLGPSLVE